MLKQFESKNVGPMMDGKLVFARKMNILTGDNSCGKSFLLDLIWFGIARCWPGDLNDRIVSGFSARPWDIKAAASLKYKFGLQGRGSTGGETCTFDNSPKKLPRIWWKRGDEKKIHYPGLVIYMMADGSFAVFDPLRNGPISENGERRLKSYVLSQEELWPKVKQQQCEFCHGVIGDWAAWQRDQDTHVFECLKAVVGALCPAEDRVEIDQLDKVPMEQGGDQPTLRLPIGRVRLQLASSAVRRMAALAYVMVWAVTEHVKAAENLGVNTNAQIFILMDEIESHLHPRWQRACIKGVCTAIEELCKMANYGRHDVQTFISTHSPLVMAAVEDSFYELNNGFDEDLKDNNQRACAWFDFDITGSVGDLTDDQRVRVIPHRFLPQGEAESWLSSDAFELKSTCSPEVETRIRELNEIFEEGGPYLVKCAAAGNDGVQIIQEKVKELARRLPQGSLHISYFNNQLKRLKEQTSSHDAD